MLSVVVLTRNEACHIEACLESTRNFADELVVFDSHSDDATRELAARAGAVVYERTFDNYPCQRNAALAAARHDWVFFVDADERASAEVGREVRAAIGKEGAERPVLFWIPRKNYIFGKWIRHTGWFPDYQPRLLRRDKARFDPDRPVHELVLADGPEGFLKQPLIHYNYETVAQFRRKQLAYTHIEAEMMFREGIRPRLRGFLGQPAREFYRRFVSLQGYRDGGHGLVLSLLMGYYAFVRQRMLAEMWAQRDRQ